MTFLVWLFTLGFFCLLQALTWPWKVERGWTGGLGWIDTGQQKSQERTEDFEVCVCEWWWWLWWWWLWLWWWWCMMMMMMMRMMLGVVVVVVVVGVVVVVVVVVLSEASGLSSFIVELATRWRPISCIQIQYMLSCCATYNLECELADYIIYTLGCVVKHGAIQQMVTFWGRCFSKVYFYMWMGGSFFSGSSEIQKSFSRTLWILFVCRSATTPMPAILNSVLRGKIQKSFME